MVGDGGRLRFCVFAGANRGRHEEYAEAASRLGLRLAKEGVDLVFGGGGVGLMRVVADAAVAGGSHVIGVIPRFLVEREVAHTALSDLAVVDSLHERKARMADLADAFVTLPGGLGTLDETLETLTWAQLALHSKPLGLVNVRGYFDPLLSLLSSAHDDGFVRSTPGELLITCENVDTVVDRLLDAVAAPSTLTVAEVEPDSEP